MEVAMQYFYFRALSAWAVWSRPQKFILLERRRPRMAWDATVSTVG
jgi:hypothetical protein